VTPEVIVLIIVASADKNAIGPWIWLLVILLSLFLVISPALIDPMVRRGRGKAALLHPSNKDA